MFKIFQKKAKAGLDKALELGLITKEEMLKLKVERATRELDQHIKKNGGKKKLLKKK